MTVASGTRMFKVTPSDTENLPHITRAIMVDAAGDVELIMAGDTEPVVWNGYAVGIFHALAIKKIKAANTTEGLNIFVTY